MKSYLKYQFIVLVVLVIFPYQLIYSQADLVVTSVNYSSNNITRGDDFKVTLVIRNRGNVSARQSYMFIYFSKDLP